MIRTEFLNNQTLIRHDSDSGKTILQIETGTEYLEAVDVVPCKYTYREKEDTAAEIYGLTNEL